MPKRRGVARWLKIGSYVFVGIFLFLDFISNLEEYPSENFGFALGATTWSLTAFMISIVCANKCSKWAADIKKSPNTAYVVGFLFGLFGLLFYWVYYKKNQ